ncbi:MAG: TIGR03790 family protein, partial [Bythopirellula sp.]
TAIFIPARELASRGRTLACAFFLGCVPLAPMACYGGGGPENVFLLVNSNSEDSLAVANHYIAVRKIPPTNVFHLPYSGGNTSALGRRFRSRILLPAWEEIERRKLTSQIDYLVYSCDFPYQVDFKREFPNEKFPPQLAPRGSLTGLTYLHAFVKEKRKEVVSLNTNSYFIEPAHGMTISRAFRSQYRWNPGGARAGAQGLAYTISSMLGVTSERGNTVTEIIHSLRSAQAADGTKPAGTVYFMKHGGPRSKPRHNLFGEAASGLRRAGVNASVLEGKFPKHKLRIIGLTCGTPFADVGTSGCRFLPGAFCDNLTSYGGFFGKRKIVIDPKTGKKRRQQVNVAEFIRYGATAASGTVFEPYSIRQKFPLPSVHVHYANGCSIGEAFYQSVSGPYQQLLVGDPLCQPWAEIPIVRTSDLANGSLIRGTIEINPEVEAEKNPIKEFQLYVDGVRNQACRPTEKFRLDTTLLEDGHHELRIVARDGTPIETQGRLILDVTVKNGRDAVALSLKDERSSPIKPNKLSLATKVLHLDVHCTTKEQVEVYCNSLKLGDLPTGTGTVNIPIEKLGAGPVVLFARSKHLRSQPLRLTIGP